MNQLYLYLYAGAPVLEPSRDEARPVVIGDLDTREPARREDGEVILLSLI